MAPCKCKFNLWVWYLWQSAKWWWKGVDSQGGDNTVIR